MSIQRIVLNINGVDREILCEPEKDSLADVVRRLGLTGTKVGCGTGHCGACSLLLDGEVTRSCVKKMKQVKAYAKVETIEGIGSAERLHPLQRAFMTYASVQCGFCSPGFIMSAKGLLMRNPDPTREEVREWFTRHGNVCRCTGYKPIVDAVMEAAAVMRGEKAMEDITFTPPEDGRLYGSDFPKPTALSRVLGTCDFGADISGKMPEGTLHLAVVLAKREHARIRALDTAEAQAMPGVVNVVTAKDVKGTNRLVAPQGTVHSLCDGLDRPVICDGVVRRYGDVVAVVAATGRDKARAAAERVRVEYEPLPAVMTFMEAAAEGAFPIHENTPNIYMEQPVYKGEDTQGLLEHAAHTVEGSFGTSRQPHLTVEPDVVLAYPQDGGVVIQCKGQYLYGNIAQMAPAIGLPKEKVRIIGNPAGGSFGYSMSPGNTALAAACALALDLVVCNLFLKPLIARPRPCDMNTAMDYLIARPHGWSFPSGHTAASFAAVFALRASGSPLWKPALVLAAGIAFSRLYLYVHWPTDVLGGILVGAAAGWAGARLADALRRRRERLGRRA